MILHATRAAIANTIKSVPYSIESNISTITNIFLSFDTVAKMIARSGIPYRKSSIKLPMPESLVCNIY